MNVNYKKIKDLRGCCLVNDDFFRYVASVCPKLLVILAAAFLGEEWTEAEAISQGDVPYAGTYFTPDGLLSVAREMLLLEMNKKYSFPNVVGEHHKRLCAARISGKAISNEVVKIACLVLSDHENAVGGRPSLILKWEGYDGEQCPEFLLAIYDVKLPQGNELLDQICHDLHCESLRDMRNKDIINAIKKARPDCEGDVMEQLYNEYTMAFINQGIEMGIEKGLERGLERGEKIGQEKASLRCGMKLVRDGTYSVKGAAELCGVDEAKLADYIESEGNGNPN